MKNRMNSSLSSSHPGPKYVPDEELEPGLPVVQRKGLRADGTVAAGPLPAVDGLDEEQLLDGLVMRVLLIATTSLASNNLFQLTSGQHGGMSTIKL